MGRREAWWSRGACATCRRIGDGGRCHVAECKQAAARRGPAQVCRGLTTLARSSRAWSSRSGMDSTWEQQRGGERHMDSGWRQGGRKGRWPGRMEAVKDGTKPALPAWHKAGGPASTPTPAPVRWPPTRRTCCAAWRWRWGGVGDGFGHRQGCQHISSQQTGSSSRVWIPKHAGELTSARAAAAPACAARRP